MDYSIGIEYFVDYFNKEVTFVLRGVAFPENKLYVGVAGGEKVLCERDPNNFVELFKLEE